MNHGVTCLLSHYLVYTNILCLISTIFHYVLISMALLLTLVDEVINNYWTRLNKMS